MRGTTSRAPDASPSHHVRQTLNHSSARITSKASRFSEPSVADSRVPARIAATMLASPLTLASGKAPRVSRRRIRTTQTTSTTFAVA